MCKLHSLLFGGISEGNRAAAEVLPHAFPAFLSALGLRKSDQGILADLDHQECRAVNAIWTAHAHSALFMLCSALSSIKQA